MSTDLRGKAAYAFGYYVFKKLGISTDVAWSVDLLFEWGPRKRVADRREHAFSGKRGSLPEGGVDPDLPRGTRKSMEGLTRAPSRRRCFIVDN